MSAKRSAVFALGCISALSISFLSQTAMAATTLPGPLVTAQWLHDHLKDVTVIDVRGEKKGKGPTTAPSHIAGALAVDFGKIREVRDVDGMKLKAMMPTKASFEKVMDDAGLDKGKTVVIVPAGDSVGSMDMATRLFFQLKYFGDDNIAILNGGTKAWSNAGYPLSTEAASAKKGNWVASAERKEILATVDDVKEGLKNHTTQLLDARPTAQYYGIVKSPVVLAAGHVEGAYSFPTEVIAKSTKGATEFMEPKQYLAIFKQKGIKPDQATITYCNTGHLASGAWFVAHEILQNKNAKLYTGSMNEWTHLKNPVVGVM
jgi:thiosulfate/3-mercaptopyruvate sulfurtransferase